MVRYELAAFIRNAREVITDPAAEHHLIGQVYSRARGPAYKFLENYYHENDQVVGSNPTGGSRKSNEIKPLGRWPITLIGNFRSVSYRVQYADG